MQDFREYNVIYNSPSLSDKGSMPIGCGEVGASVFATEQKISFYISRSDSLSEADRNLKLGMVNLSFTPNVLQFSTFEQRLNLQKGSVSFSMREQEKSVYGEIFAERQTGFIRIKFKSNFPVKIDAQYYNWRNAVNKSVNELGLNNSLIAQIYESADIVYSAGADICFYHLNNTSIVSHTAALEALDINFVEDNLINRSFGGVLQAIYGVVKSADAKEVHDSNHNCKREFNFEGGKNFSYEFIVKTFCAKGCPKELIENLRQVKPYEYDISLKLNEEFWTDFFLKSYIYVQNDKAVSPKISARHASLGYENTQVNLSGSNVSRAYILSKYMQKCCTGGTYPIRFNGGHFNLSVGEEYGKASMPECITCRPLPVPQIGKSPDERSWGNMLLWQNERLPYYSMLWQNERQDIKKFLQFYCSFSKLNAHKAQKYYNAKGEYSTEIITSFGLTPNYLYGYDRTQKADGYVENRHGGAVDISPGLEQSYFMLKYVNFYNDTEFLNNEALPFIKNLFEFVKTRFSGRNNGKIVIYPLNSIETYRDTLNPITVVAGLRAVIKAVLESEKISEQEKSYYKEYLNIVPQIPKREKNGKVLLAPAESYDVTRHNVECPEIYAIFPFDNLYEEIGGEVLHSTYLNGLSESGNFREMVQGELSSEPSFCGWHYEGIVAAMLGITADAERILQYNSGYKNINARFPAYFGAAYDSLPDTDHCANIMNVLQNMVMRVENRTVTLFPALPKKWNAEFKLWVEEDIFVQGVYQSGKIISAECNDKSYTLKY